MRLLFCLLGQLHQICPSPGNKLNKKFLQLLPWRVPPRGFLMKECARQEEYPCTPPAMQFSKPSTPLGGNSGQLSSPLFFLMRLPSNPRIAVLQTIDDIQTTLLTGCGKDGSGSFFSTWESHPCSGKQHQPTSGLNKRCGHFLGDCCLTLGVLLIGVPAP